MKHLILGFGAAGANAAETIRRLDDQAEITVLSGEARSFYLRLDLEGIFFGKSAADLMPRSPAYWNEKRIAVLHDPAQTVDTARREVIAASGRVVPYDMLLIATGASPRVLDLPGRELAGVFSYHTLDDAERISAMRERARRVVIIGGGILALEMARVAVHFGWHTTLLVRRNHIGSPIVDASGGAFVLEALRRAAVNVIFEDEVAAFEGENGKLRAVRTRGGLTLRTDMTVTCVGVVPSVSFLEGSVVLTNRRLIVNPRMQAPAPDVYAAGDVAVVRSPDGRETACSTWNVASAQARVAAANMCGGDAVWEEGVLYNLDYLFDQEFALIGKWDRRHEPGYVVHETSGGNSYRALVTRDGVLEGALLLGDRGADRRVRKLIAARARVENRIESVFDSSVPVEAFK